MNLERRCPRCRHRNWHPAKIISMTSTSFRRAGAKLVTIACCSCGHRWHGRYRKIEWDEPVHKPKCVDEMLARKRAAK